MVQIGAAAAADSEAFAKAMALKTGLAMNWPTAKQVGW